MIVAITAKCVKDVGRIHKNIQEDKLKTHHIESMALKVIDMVKQGYRVEDTRVECKLKLGEDRYHIARQLAGHANAHRGENLLWLIGLKENERADNQGMKPEDNFDLADFRISLQSQFEGDMPYLEAVRITHQGQHFIALHIECNSLPYLVKNPKFRGNKDEKIRVEIPWRNMTSTNTATREEILLLLAEPRKSLIVKTRGCVLDLTDPEQNGSYKYKLVYKCFIAPELGQRLFIDPEDCRATFTYTIQALGTRRQLTVDCRADHIEPALSISRMRTSGNPSMPVPQLELIGKTINVDGPGEISFVFLGNWQIPGLPIGDIVQIVFELATMDMKAWPTIVHLDLQIGDSPVHAIQHWVYPAQD